MHHESISASTFLTDPGNGAGCVLPEGVNFHKAIRTISAGLRIVGCPPAAAAAFRDLAEYTNPDAWTNDSAVPMNWRRQGVMAASMGITARRLWQIERTLEQYKVIERATPANGYRGHRQLEDGSGCSCGLSFAPAIRSYKFFRSIQVEEEQRAAAIEASRGDLRRAVGQLRRGIQTLRNLAPDHELIDEAETFRGSLPATGCRSREVARFASAAAETRAFNERLETAISACSEAFHVEETTHACQKDSTCYIQIQPKREPVIVAHRAPTQNINTTADHPHSPQPSAQPAHPSPQVNLSDSAIFSLMTDDLQMLVNIQPTDLSARERLFAASEKHCAALGIHHSAWQEALDVMGAELAVLALIILDRNRFHPDHPVKSPGGALRALTRRAIAGEMHLDRAIWAIWARERLGRQPKSDQSGAASPEAAATDGAPVPFPARGGLYLDNYWEPIRGAECNWDDRIVADKFRAFARKNNISLDQADIETIFRRYCRRLPRA